MKQYSIIIIMLFCFLHTNAQVESIELPEGEETIQITNITPFFSIYVDKNNMVYLEKQLVEIYEIGKLLTYYSYKLPDEHRLYIQVHLYIDKNVGYGVVDNIKTEIATNNLFNIVYKINTLEDKDALNGIYLRNHSSFFKLNHIEKQPTEKQKIENKEYNDSLNKSGIPDVPPPPPPPAHWAHEFQYKLYSDQQDIIDEALHGVDYSCIVIHNNGIKTNSEIISLNDISNIEALFLQNDVLLVSFDDDLDYATYLETIRVFISIKKKYKNEKNAIPFEVSSELVKIHKKSNVKLCN